MKIIIDLDHTRTHEQLERLTTFFTLYLCKNNKTRACERLRITTRGLRNKMKRWKAENKSYEIWLTTLEITPDIVFEKNSDFTEK
jgi:DNA-binding NtrC family response regulator